MAKVNEMSSPNDSEQIIHMDVLCLMRFSDYVLAGIGNKLFVYKDQYLKISVPIFLNERIHNLYEDNDNVLVKGGKQLALVRVENIGDIVNVQCIHKISCSDWIHSVIKLHDGLLGLATFHNLFEVWDLSLKERIDLKSCAEKCILYSCKIIKDLSGIVLISSGTVFGEILVWNPFGKEKKNLLQRFKAHDGAVFSIESSIEERVLLSTSDDRSLKVWSLNIPESPFKTNEWKFVSVKPLHVLFGHRARVWKSLIIPNFYITVGEDSQLIIWKKNGTIFKKLILHQESGIRGLSFSREKNEIYTGGEDGGINVICCEYLTSELYLLLKGKINNSDKNFSTKLCFVKNGFVYTTIGGCVFVGETQEEQIYYSEDFLQYCILEVSSLGNCIALGSIKGHLVIINVESKSIISEEILINGRIYSIHWLNDDILTCGPNGCLNLWHISKNELTFLITFILPPSKERWTTCASIQNDNLIVGDRMGNIHIYNLKENSETVQTFWKIHSHLGVTDILNNSKNILSIGRDGTLKNLSISEGLSHLCTNKLPMEWPWKIFTYKNDKLILGFHGVLFMVWSVKFREVVTTLDCGGGHRPCHCILDGDSLKFLYIKDKKILQADLSLKGLKRLREGFHSKEINALKIVEIEPAIIVTGSEDTTVRISLLTAYDIVTFHVLTTHMSSVRTVSTCWLDKDNILIVSAGGKAQIILWRLNIKTNEYQELVNCVLKSENRNWKSSKPTPDPETRFMCIDILKIEDEYLIAAGGSDCRIRIFSFNVSMATDGKMVFWSFGVQNFSPMQSGNFFLHQSGINSFAFKKVEPEKLMVITGGDDNKLAVSLVELSENEVKLNQVWSNSSLHSCQITGIKIIENFFLTTSIDQRITLWKWSYVTSKFEVQYVDQKLTSVPDVQGLDAKLCSDDILIVVVWGKGIESVKFNCRDFNF